MRELFRVQAPRREKLRQMRRPGRFDANSGRLADADGIIFARPSISTALPARCVCSSKGSSFQYFVYDADYSALSPKRMPTAFVYTMNVPYQVMLESHYTESFQSMESFIQRVFSKPETLYVNDTYQFSDYSKYKADRFSETDKARHREQQFPIDCQKAFELGKALVKRNG